MPNDVVFSLIAKLQREPWGEIYQCFVKRFECCRGKRKNGECEDGSARVTGAAKRQGSAFESQK